MLLLILEPQSHEFVAVLFIQSLLCMQLASKNYNKILRKIYLRWVPNYIGNNDILLSVELPIMAPLIGRSDTDPI